MNLEQLIDQFELVTDTEEGLVQFRNVILNLAFKGELTKQNVDSESGRKLLERLKVKKQKMYDNGEIRKPKDLSDIDESEMPFKLPQNWTWCRLGNIYHNWGNKTPDKDFQYIDVSSINNEKGEIGNEIEVIKPEDAPSRAKRIVKKGTVLYSTVRPYLLNVAIYDGSFEYEPIASTAFEVIHPIDGVYNRYIYHYLRSPIFTEYVDSTMVGVAYPAVNKGDMIEGYFPLPPIEEQKHIVKKIETLFSQVDELEQKVQQDREVDERLQVAVLDDLQLAETPEASKQSWQRITNQFKQIYRKPEHIDQLKQAILNEAVRGRLVPQDPNDEPAEKLLERIKEEKQRLYEEGGIRKPKDLPGITDEEIPYELPKEWTWSRLGNIYHNWGNKTPDKEFQYIDVSSIDNEKGEIGNKVEVIRPDDAPSRAKRIVKKGTVLYSTVRPYLLNVAIYKGDFEYEPIASTAFEVIHPLEGIFNKYIYHYLRSQTFTEYVDGTMVGVAYPAVNKGDMIEAYFPLPPTEEQIRIAKKIEELFTWCDDLKEKLSRSQQTDQRLLEALVNGYE